jgi:cysteine desulfurase / selenocysteine lyase
MIYFDNAATSWPKPPGVIEAVVQCMTEAGANPGRSGHRMSVAAARLVYQARESVAALLGVDDPLRIVFGLNVTEALNLALRGLLHPGDHVIASAVEHNSVMRPLRALERQSVEVSIVPCTPEGVLDPKDVQDAITDRTALIVMNHASNVVGTLLPVAEVGRIARDHGVLFLVDAAQTAGAYPIDVQAMQIDLLAFTGHKALGGPMGTGGLWVGERVGTSELEPLKRGGTGSLSEHEQQPDFLPDLYESGTANAPGIAGLGAAVRWVLEKGVSAIRAHEVILARRLIDGLLAIPGVTVYGTHDAERQTATVSLNVRGMEPSDVAFHLDEEYDIMCRSGLHCSPATHRTIGTFPRGTARLSMSVLNTVDEVDIALDAIASLTAQ